MKKLTIYDLICVVLSSSPVPMERHQIMQQVAALRGVPYIKNHNNCYFFNNKSYLSAFKRPGSLPDTVVARGLMNVKRRPGYANLYTLTNLGRTVAESAKTILLAA